MTSTIFQKINDIYQCKLTLEDNSEFVIPLREDGYIYATALCKVVKKKVNDWLRLSETKKILNELEKKTNNITTGNPDVKKILIEVYKGGSGKYLKGTWIHPDLGIQLAQWCSSSFSLQVSKWIRELIFTDKVEIGKEKEDEEITKELQEKIKKAEDIIVSYDNENKYLLKKYNKLHQTHQRYLKHKELYKMKEGQCLYIIDMCNDGKKIKVGQCGSINLRTATFRTSNPHCQILFLLYTPQSVLLETNMKLRYEENLFPNNSEFISGVEPELIIKDCINICEMLRIPHEIEKPEEIEKFNRRLDEIEDESDYEVEFDEEKFKRCGGTTHTTEESRIQPFTNFFKNASNPDGYARLCKECYLVGRYGDKRKRRKVVIPPTYDILTHKWCNKCETVRERGQFYRASDTKDGLCANCKICKNAQKKEYNLRKATEVEV